MSNISSIKPNLDPLKTQLNRDPLQNQSEQGLINLHMQNQSEQALINHTSNMSSIKPNLDPLKNQS